MRYLMGKWDSKPGCSSPLWVHDNHLWPDVWQLATWQFLNLNVHPCSWAVGSNVLGSVEGFWRGHLQIWRWKSRGSCRFALTSSLLSRGFLPESWTERRLTPSRSWWRPGFLVLEPQFLGWGQKKWGAQSQEHNIDLEWFRYMHV